MSISAIDSNSSQVSATQQKLQTARSNFQQLQKAWQSGDLASAQQAYDAMKSNAPNGGPSSNGKVSQAFAALGDALKSGDVSKAQQAFSTFQQGLRQVGHQHHHHHVPSQDTSNSNVDKATAAVAGDPNLGATVNVTA